MSNRIESLRYIPQNDYRKTALNNVTSRQKIYLDEQCNDDNAVGFPNRLIDAPKQRGIPVDQVELRAQDRPAASLNTLLRKAGSVYPSRRVYTVLRVKGGIATLFHRQTTASREAVSKSPSYCCVAQCDSGTISQWLSIFL